MGETVDLSKKKIDLEGLAGKALVDDGTLSQLLEGISPLNHNIEIRNNSFQALMILSERHPDFLLPHWEHFAGMITNPNSSMRYIAIHILANLAASDRQGKFEAIFDAYFHLLEDRSVMVAAHLAEVSGQIACARQELRERIIDRLLAVDRSPLDEGRKDLVRGYVIESLEKIYPQAVDRQKILEFVRVQLISTSPKTRKLAARFLKTWS